MDHAAKRMTFQDGDRLVSRTDNWGELGTIHVEMDGKGSAAFTLIRISEPPLLKQIPNPNPTDVIIRPRVGSSDYNIYRQVGSAAAALLLNKRPIELNDLIATISKQLHPVKGHIVADYVRCQVASGLLVANARLPSEVMLSLSTHGIDGERTRQFAASFAADLASYSDRIRNLIRHRPTTGNYREGLLRDLLHKYLPKRYHVASGFIFGSDRQLDLIIYDQIEYSPIFREGDLVVVTLESVRAVIEVKTVLSNQALCDALEILHTAVPSTHSGPPIFKGIFAFERPEQSGFIPQIKGFYNPDSEDLDESFKAIEDFYTPITAVCVLNRSLVLVNFQKLSVSKAVILAPAAFELFNAIGRTAEAAYFIDLLGRFLRHPFEGPRQVRSVADFLAHELSISEPHWLYDGLWGPYEFDDFDEQRDALAKTATAYDEWLNGGAWKLPSETHEPPAEAANT